MICDLRDVVRERHKVKKELLFGEGEAIILTWLISTMDAPRKELCHDP